MHSGRLKTVCVCVCGGGGTVCVVCVWGVGWRGEGVCGGARDVCVYMCVCVCVVMCVRRGWEGGGYTPSLILVLPLGLYHT